MHLIRYMSIIIIIIYANSNAVNTVWCGGVQWERFASYLLLIGVRSAQAHCFCVTVEYSMRNQLDFVLGHSI